MAQEIVSRGKFHLVPGFVKTGVTVSDSSLKIIKQPSEISGKVKLPSLIAAFSSKDQTSFPQRDGTLCGDLAIPISERMEKTPKLWKRLEPPLQNLPFRTPHATAEYSSNVICVLTSTLVVWMFARSEHDKGAQAPSTPSAFHLKKERQRAST